MTAQPGCKWCLLIAYSWLFLYIAGPYIEPKLSGMFVFMAWVYGQYWNKITKGLRHD